jgi:hypothetical protein
LANREEKAKLGETVVVKLAKKKKAAAAKRPEDRRYGPPPILDEKLLRRKGKVTTIHFLNQQSEFLQVPQFDTIPPERELRYQNKWVPDAFVLANLSLNKNVGVRRYSDATTFVTYRQAWDKHPLPYETASDYGITLKLNGGTKNLSPANDEWIAYEPDLDNANEVAEWAAAYGSAQTFWVPINTDWHRKYGYYEKKLARRYTYAIASSGNFEPFDPFDTVNYKVTQGAYADPEVAAPRLNHKEVNDLRFGLIPKIWDVAVTYFSWWYQPDPTFTVPNRIWKRSNSVSGIMTAITTPYFNEVGGFTLANCNKFTVNFTDFDGGGVTSHFSTWNHSQVIEETDGIPAPFDDIHRVIHMELLQLSSSEYIMSRIGARDLTFTNEGDFPANSKEHLDSTHATLAITERDRAAGDLVGIFSLNEELFRVYRKTADVRGGVIYSGGHDGLLGARSTAFYPDFDTYTNPIQSRTDIDFNYYDPTNALDHMTA